MQADQPHATESLRTVSGGQQQAARRHRHPCDSNGRARSRHRCQVDARIKHAGLKMVPAVREAQHQQQRRDCASSCGVQQQAQTQQTAVLSSLVEQLS